jgi:hypothetical protein
MISAFALSYQENKNNISFAGDYSIFIQASTETNDSIAEVQ